MNSFEINLMLPFVLMIAFFALAITLQRKGERTNRSKQPLLGIMYVAGILSAFATIGSIIGNVT